MMRFGVLIELLATIALIVGVPIPIAGTVALIAATLTSAVAILRKLKTDNTLIGVIDVVFYFFTWTLIPCMLVQYATNGVSENLFRFLIAARVFAAASLWSLSMQWQRKTGSKQ
jgi:hypothetical protein